MSKLPFGLKIGLYYFTAFLFTGIFSVLQGVSGIRGEYFQFPQIGPALASVIFIALEGNSIKMFFKRGFRFTLEKYTAGMILVTILLILSVSILSSSLWGAENFNKAYVSIDGAFFVLSTIVAAMCEEIGWRGYLLTRLQSRMNPVKASIILSILWGFWHVPKLLMGIEAFSAWFIGIIGLTIVLTYTFNRTKGNIWAVTLIHSAVNLMSAFFLIGFVSDVRISLLNSVSYIIWAAAVIIFGRKPVNKNDETTVSSKS